jgi:hypothetical protein
MKRALAFVCLFVLLASALVAAPELALTMTPALLLLALLAGGVRPGEALIERLRDRRTTPLPRPAARAPRPRLALIVRPPAGPVASALAMRPPPSGSAVLS